MKKKMIIGLIVGFILLSSIVVIAVDKNIFTGKFKVRKEFADKPPAEDHEQEILTGQALKWEVEIADVQQKLHTADVEIFWDMVIFREGVFTHYEVEGVEYPYQECDEMGENCVDTTKTIRTVFMEETLSSIVPETYTDKEIEETVKKHANAVFEQWKPRIKVMYNETIYPIIGKTISKDSKDIKQI